MPAPEQSVIGAPPERREWLSDADSRALLAAAWWFDTVAPPELKQRYRGMHVAIYGERVIDADCDKDALYRRWEADPVAFPPNQVLPRYVPTEEEAARFRY